MYPSYLNLSSRELKVKIGKLFQFLKKCRLCPRECGVNRLKGEKGFCKLGGEPMISAFHPHFGEESPLVGKNGSGTIFFTSCNLSCVYCQNYDISQLRKGRETSFEELAETMIYLQNLGCCNINLVTPTPQIPQIVKSLSLAVKQGLEIPLVYNTGTYDSVETLKLLEGIVDIYMPDTKYSNREVGIKYSNAPHYFEVMKKAITEMYNQVGDLMINSQGIAERGLLVRHLVLPKSLAGSEKIFSFLSQLSQNTFLNIMKQYHPSYRAFDFPELSRGITVKEYQDVVKAAKKSGLKKLYLS